MENFKYLHEKLGHINKLKLESGCFSCPLAYPLYVKQKELRKKLIDNEIFVATYWPNVIKECNINYLEYDLAKNIMPLPIDPRYNISDNQKLTNLLHQYGKI